MGTTNFNLPLYGPGDTAELDTLLNGQSEAIDVALADIDGRNTRHRGLAANRPAAGNKGALYFATDSNILWYDNGTTWKNRTPGIFAQVTSSTGAVNGSATLSWDNTHATMFIDTGGFYIPGNPTRAATVPYNGWYRVSYTVRTTGIAPVTANLTINGTTSAYMVSSSTGESGGATMATRSGLIKMTAGDYIAISLSSSATAGGIHNLYIEYLGEV